MLSRSAIRSRTIEDLSARPKDALRKGHERGGRILLDLLTADDGVEDERAEPVEEEAQAARAEDRARSVPLGLAELGRVRERGLERVRAPGRNEEGGADQPEGIPSVCVRHGERRQVVEVDLSLEDRDDDHQAERDERADPEHELGDRALLDAEVVQPEKADEDRRSDDVGEVQVDAEVGRRRPVGRPRLPRRPLALDVAPHQERADGEDGRPCKPVAPDVERCDRSEVALPGLRAGNGGPA